MKLVKVLQDSMEHHQEQNVLAQKIDQNGDPSTALVKVAILSPTIVMENQYGNIRPINALHDLPTHNHDSHIIYSPIKNRAKLFVSTTLKNDAHMATREVTRGRVSSKFHYQEGQ